jgi:hypothetical protein
VLEFAGDDGFDGGVPEFDRVLEFAGDDGCNGVLEFAGDDELLEFDGVLETMGLMEC